MERARTTLYFLAIGCLSLATAVARADVPADYQGKPYKGTPATIPGRVELANLDTGGFNVSYNADHNRTNSAGYEPISGNDYRPDEKDLPNICKTNTQNMDKWAADGAVYPSESDRYWYYMGYAHAQDWVKLTVNVARAGMYTVSSNWASEGPELGLSIWFNDGHSPVDPMRPHDGVNKTGIVTLPGTSDYHIWKAYPKFATIELAAGVQVMTFHLEKHDHLQYGFLQFDPVGGGDDAGGIMDASSTGPGGRDSASAGAAGGAGSGGTASVGASGAGAGDTLVSGGGSAGKESARASDAPAAADSGCSCRTGRTGRGKWAIGVAASLLFAARLRRYRSRRGRSARSSVE